VTRSRVTDQTHHTGGKVTRSRVTDKTHHTGGKVTRSRVTDQTHHTGEQGDQIQSHRSNISHKCTR